LADIMGSIKDVRNIDRECEIWENRILSRDMS
jgi:hypothetical protein